MSGITQSSSNKIMRFLRTATPPVDTSETELCTGVPCGGYGSGRLWVYSNVAGTIKVYQKPRRLSASALTSYRQTDNIGVAAASSTMAALNFDIRSDRLRVTFTATACAPPVFEASGELLG